jgi:hypothetical protein
MDSSFLYAGWTHSLPVLIECRWGPVLQTLVQALVIVKAEVAINAGMGFRHRRVILHVVEWRGASQPRALPEPDVNLSIHPAPIIGPLVPGSNERTVLDCDVLPNTTSPNSP